VHLSALPFCFKAQQNGNYSERLKVTMSRPVSAHSSFPDIDSHLTRRDFLKQTALMGIGLACTVGAAAWATKYEPHWIETIRVSLPVKGMHPAFEGLTLAQISDLHIGGWMNERRLAEVVDAVNVLQPDLVAITGDFINSTPYGYLELMERGLARLNPKIDVFGVLGNHDHWAHPHIIRDALDKSGVQELNNSFHTLERDGGTLHICGLDDAWMKMSDLSRVLETLPSKGAAILLAHEPDPAIEYAQAGRFAAHLAGHTHGGQIRAPLIGALHLPKHGEIYQAGLYSVGKKPEQKLQLYVNRGVGMVWPYVRLNCRPEITLFTLTTA
jgi:predicted MPP superfamily phosphohydrolase